MDIMFSISWILNGVGAVWTQSIYDSVRLISLCPSWYWVPSIRFKWSNSLIWECCWSCNLFLVHVCTSHDFILKEEASSELWWQRLNCFYSLMTFLKISENSLSFKTWGSSTILHQAVKVGNKHVTASIIREEKIYDLIKEINLDNSYKWEGQCLFLSCQATFVDG